MLTGLTREHSLCSLHFTQSLLHTIALLRPIVKVVLTPLKAFLTENLTMICRDTIVTKAKCKTYPPLKNVSKFYLLDVGSDLENRKEGIWVIKVHLNMVPTDLGYNVERGFW